MSEKKIEIRPFRFSEDYPEVCEWWRARAWKAPARSKLSPFGAMAVEGDTRLAVAWLYVTGSGWGLLEYTVTNPEAPVLSRGRAVRLIVERLSEVAEEAGVEDLVTFTESKGLQRLLQKCGFNVGDKNLTSLIRRIQ